jgi:hypothetical protein
MTLKEGTETAQSLFTIVAIVVGGLWTYNVFVKERKQYPHANIEQKISHLALPQRNHLLRVGVELTNTGTARLLSGKSIIRVQQVLPMPGCPGQGPCAAIEVKAALVGTGRQNNEFSWPLLAEREQVFEPPLDIEPGEKELVEYEFALPADIEVVRVYSYFRNDKKTSGRNETGWTVSSHFDFRRSENKGALK